MKRGIALLLAALLCTLASAQQGMGPGPFVGPFASGTATPILFQDVSNSANPAGIGVAGHAYVQSYEALPANTVAVMAVVALHGKTITVTDTLVGSWSAAVCSADAGTGNYITEVFVQPLGATGGTDTITVGVGASATNPVSMKVSFFTNIATTAPANGHLCTANITPTSGGVISPGSFTPTNNNANGGNIVWNYNNIAFAATFNPTGWTPGSGFNLLGSTILWTSNQGFPTSSQYTLQTTSASITPSITGVGENTMTNDYNSVSVALKVANNGATAPSTIHVARIMHSSFNTFASPGTMKEVMATTGNLRVVLIPWTGGCPDLGAGCTTGGTWSDGCSTSLIGGSGGSGGATIIYAQNCSPCPACTFSLTFTGTETIGQGSFRIYDVQNALASSVQNSTSGLTASCTGTTISNSPSFTPTGATSGLAFSVFGNELGVTTALASGSPAAAVFDLATYTGETSADMMENADASNHIYYSSLAAQTWNYTLSTSPTECYFAAAAFN